MILLLTYMIIYNVTSFLLFTTILQSVGSAVTSLFAFSNFGSTNSFTKVISLSLLSLAGVPPLLGFFSKIFIFSLVANAHLGILFLPFFIILFMGLYFYIQNIRFLNSTNAPTISLPSEISYRLHLSYFRISIPLAFFIVFGFCYVDELLLMSLWVLV